MEKVLHTSFGEIHYQFVRKPIKNLNLRIHPDHGVSVSAPLRMPKKDIEAFLQSKAEWIFKKQQGLQSTFQNSECLYTKEQCLALFTSVSDRLYPLFAFYLKEKPVLAVRDMKTRWGSCHPHKKKITLNMRLAEQAPELIEYVVLHEYVHFLHPNHGSDFHAEMARLMPDYRERRKKLRG